MRSRPVAASSEELLPALAPRSKNRPPTRDWASGRWRGVLTVWFAGLCVFRPLPNGKVCGFSSPWALGEWTEQVEHLSQGTVGDPHLIL